MKYFSTLSTTFSLLSVCALVSAHGYVQNVTIAGKTYKGWLPFDDPYIPGSQSIVRKIPDDGPVTDITSPDLACNKGGETAAALIADVNAGDKVTFTINRWPADHLGPVTIYMANCGGSCSTFNPSTGNVWFKIDQASLSNGVWATSKLIAQGDSWSVNIPSGIKPGQYLIRLELLALHSAGAPQFYPSCSQLNIKGTGSDVPTSSSLVAIPGVYANAGNAIYGDIWSNPTSWPLVGPKIVSFATNSGGGGGGNPPPSSPTPPTNVAPTPSHHPSSRTTSTTSTSSTALPSQGGTSHCKRKVNRSNLKRVLIAPERVWSSHSKARRAMDLLHN